MLSPEETAHRRRINRFLLPIVALVVMAVVVVIVAVSCTSGTSEETDPSTMKAAPEMTDEEYAQFRDKALAIDPNLSEDHLRNDARDSCSGIDGDNAVKNVATRFSRDDYTVDEDEAQKIVELIRGIGFCER